MIRFALISAIVFGGACQVHADLILLVDDFQAEPVPPIPPSYIANYTGFAKWDVIGSGVDLVGPGGLFPPRINSLMVDLDGTSGSTLISKQTINLVPGLEYFLKFDLGGPVGGTLLDTVVVSLGSAFNESFIIFQDAPFVTVTRTIQVAAPTNVKLSFSDLGADSNGGFVDNIQLSAVPEPSTLVIFSGVFIVGGWLRRRAKR